MKFGRTRTLQSAKYLQKKRKKNIFLVTAISISILLIIFLKIFIIRLPILQIKSIEISGVETSKILEVDKRVRDQISGNRFYFIPKSSFLFYPKSKIKNDLLENFKEIKEIEVEVKGVSKLSVDIVERIPKVISCEGFREDGNESECNFVDENGYIFSRVTDSLASSSLDYFKYYTNLSVNDNIKKFSELQSFVKVVNDLGLHPTGILVAEDGSYELYIKNKDESSMVVYFDDRIPFERALSNFTVFWQNVIDKKIGFNNVPVFEYINLRFGNNIYFLAK